MENKRIHWGIIGCGDVTEKKSGPAFYTLPNTALTAVMRRDGVKAADYAKRHHVQKWYDNASSLINDPEVEAVYIATPPDSHAQLAIESLKNGKPVYVEKPMALNYAQCIKMIEASALYKTPLFVAYYRREQPYFLKVKELLQNQAIGQVKHVSLSLIRTPLPDDYNKEKPWRLDVNKAGGGYFADMGSHQLDMLLFLFGPISSHRSLVLNKGGLYDPEDYVNAIFQFESGVTAQAIWYFAAPSPASEDCIEIIGTKGTLKFSIFDMTPIVVKTETEEQVYDIGKPAIVEAPMIEKVSEELVKGQYTAEALHDAAEVTRLIEEILSPYYNKATL